MILRSPTKHENGDRHAGMDGRHPGAQDASGNIQSAWIPALHAGMTESRSRTKTDPGPPPRVFSKEVTKFKKIFIEKRSETFVSFVLFVVNEIEVKVTDLATPKLHKKKMGGCNGKSINQ
jgi:hypothetical protein